MVQEYYLLKVETHDELDDDFYSREDSEKVDPAECIKEMWNDKPSDYFNFRIEEIEMFSELDVDSSKKSWSIVGKDAEDVEMRLNHNNISCKVSFDDCGDFEYFIIKILDENCHMYDISKALNIDITDVGIIENGKYYIVEIKNDEG